MMRVRTMRIISDLFGGLYRWDAGQAILKPAISLGVRADRNLRLTDRLDRLAVLARRGVRCEIFDRRGLLDNERSIQGAGRSVEPLLNPEPSEAKHVQLVYTCGPPPHIRSFA